MTIDSQINAHIQAERARKGWSVQDLLEHAAVHADGPPMSAVNLKSRLYSGTSWRTGDLRPFALALGAPSVGDFIAAAEQLAVNS